jgi:hypothetical protein
VFLRFARSEVEDEIAQPQDSARAEERCHPLERDRLPEVWKLVQGVACVDHVRRLAPVLVGEEPAVDHGHVVEPEVLAASAERHGHRGRDVHGDDLAAQGCDRRSEGAGACTEIDDRRARAQAPAAERVDVLGGIEPGLAVVAGDVAHVEVLVAGVGDLVEPPSPHHAES